MTINTCQVVDSAYEGSKRVNKAAVGGEREDNHRKHGCFEVAVKIVSAGEGAGQQRRWMQKWWATENLNLWSISRSMSKVCGRRGVCSVGSKEEERPSRVLQEYSRVNVTKKQREMWRDLNNSLHILSDSALPN